MKCNCCGNAMEPSVLSSEWVTVAGVLLTGHARAMKFHSPPRRADFGSGSNPAGVNVTFLDPSANQTTLLLVFARFDYRRL